MSRVLGEFTSIFTRQRAVSRSFTHKYSRVRCLYSSDVRHASRRTAPWAEALLPNPLRRHAALDEKRARRLHERPGAAQVDQALLEIGAAAADHIAAEPAALAGPRVRRLGQGHHDAQARHALLQPLQL